MLKILAIVLLINSGDGGIEFHATKAFPDTQSCEEFINTGLPPVPVGYRLITKCYPTSKFDTTKVNEQVN
jgi:hypothetical protein